MPGEQDEHAAVSPPEEALPGGQEEQLTPPVPAGHTLPLARVVAEGAA